VLGDLLVRSGHNCASEGYRLIHRFLDKTIGLAVKTYAQQKATEVQLQRQEYLSFVAHELRTPLSSIAMGMALIQRSYTGSGETASLFEAVHRSVSRLKSLVVQVVREENGGRAAERVATPLRPVVQVCVDEMTPMALFTGVVVVNAVSDGLVCQADPVLLTQILQNLLSNAIRYSPGGEVTVGARVVTEETECWVRDNGVGIPADRIERVFAKWETDPDREAEGMGLGLNIVRQYVEAHGGRVSVQSPPGEGATFTFTLRH
jgi:signal transduction histidine kinase